MDRASRFAIEIVNSPDDGGFWISAFDPESEKSRASEQIYSTEAEAQKALRNKSVKWEPWS